MESSEEELRNRQWWSPRSCCWSWNNLLAHIPHPPRFGGPEMRFYWWSGNSTRRTIVGGQGSGTQPSKQGSSLRDLMLISDPVELFCKARLTCKAMFGAHRWPDCRKSLRGKLVCTRSRSSHGHIARGTRPGFSTFYNKTCFDIWPIAEIEKMGK